GLTRRGRSAPPRSAGARGLRVEEERACAARWTRHHATDAIDALAGLGEYAGEPLCAAGLDNRDHAEPAIENPGELAARETCRLREPPEDRRQGPGAGVELHAQAGRDHARDILDPPPATHLPHRPAP